MPEKRGKAFNVTPWEVSGDIDYGKLIKEFGVSKIDNKLLERISDNVKEIHPMLRRKVFLPIVILHGF